MKERLVQRDHIFNDQRIGIKWIKIGQKRREKSKKRPINGIPRKKNIFLMNFKYQINEN